jgi:4,5:9,10-diseco-3-hydroxy-5,9,17-trioxoandrosta-1(10),2-diene-4-oate hydrolase
VTIANTVAALSAQEPHRWQVGASPTRRTAMIDGVEIAYDDSGAGLVVIGLHATAHGSRDFELVRPALSRRYRLITLDWPGHGRSGDDHRPFDAIRCGEVLDGIVKQLGLQQAIIIGCSIGGAAAIRYAATHSERVLGLVICNSGGLARIDTVARLFCRMMVGLARAGMAGRPWFQPLFALFCRDILQAASARDQRRRIIAAGAECAKPMADAWTSFAQPEADLRSRAATLACPVLFAWARNDKVVVLSKSRAAIASVPDHELELFEGGHCAFLEAPEEFVARFDRFVARFG